MFGPGGGGFFEGALGLLVLLEHPLRLVAEFVLALGERLPSVAEGDLRFLELRAELDGALILGDGWFVGAAVAISVAIPGAAVVSIARTAVPARGSVVAVGAAAA
jgi:hypothetical protein